MRTRTGAGVREDGRRVAREFLGLLIAGLVAACARDGPTGVPQDGDGESSAPAAPRSPVGLSERLAPGARFRDALRVGGEGPEMVVIPAGRFHMGCVAHDMDCYDDEKLAHEVAITEPFALGAREVTFEDYDRYTYPERLDVGGYARLPQDPVFDVSWEDAQGYVRWLSAQTGARYRLPSEAEWEYAARAEPLPSTLGAARSRVV